MTKPTIPEVIDRFKAYHKDNPSWGALHIVLDDNNVNDLSVDWCRVRARQDGDKEGEALAHILLSMSRTQRLKIGDMVR
jgi:hypothetical protein